MASSVLVAFLLLLLIRVDSVATTSSSRIPLSTSTKYYPSSSSTDININPSWESIRLAARSSLARACHLKRRRPLLSGNVKLPSYPRNYGGYSIRLSLGTPSQTVSMVMDTGSSLVGTPCTTKSSVYSCLNCTFLGVDPTKIPTYKLNKSSTVRLVGCKSPKCAWVFGSGSNCPQCNPKQSNCSAHEQPCPDYILEYGLGATVGQLVSDKLELSKNTAVADFVFGCSFSSLQQPEGIAGFGRGSASLPAQLGLRKFSYCLVSHNFDDSANKSGDLVLYGATHHHVNYSASTAGGVSYAPFRKSPAVSPYSQYYYVALDKIMVGSKSVPLPSRYLAASSKGNGGVIVDSGSTFTFMERAIHDPVARELEKHMSRRYKRAKDMERKSGLGPCYDFGGKKNVNIPKLVLMFKGGARMDLPVDNYFWLIGRTTVVCMTILTDTETQSPPAGRPGLAVPSGPAIILGNYQQQNFYVEYDLGNQRFGFKPQRCG